MDTDHSFWHARFRQQAIWTNNTRRFIFKEVDISLEDSLLEVGCGSGAILEVLEDEGFKNTFGIDHNVSTLLESRINHPITCADGLHLPYVDASFSYCLCHFYLMWVSDPLAALREMARVTAPGGWLMALAEPDYGGRINYPQSLENLGKMQVKSLEKQGADTNIGRSLLSLFNECELENVNAGIITAGWGSDKKTDALKNDLQVLKRDLAHVVAENELNELLSHAEGIIANEANIWFVPIFYTFGQVTTPENVLDL